MFILYPFFLNTILWIDTVRHLKWDFFICLFIKKCLINLLILNLRPFNIILHHLIMKRHGLLRCKNGCGLWNRDTNGAINIWRIAVEAIGRRERPEYLRRTKRSISGVSSTPTTHDLHEDLAWKKSHFKCRTV